MGKGLLDKIITAGKNQPASANVQSNQPMAQVVIDNISDGIAIVDTKGIIQLFNPAAAQLTGWKSNDAVNLDYRSIFKLLNSAEREVDANENPILQAMHTMQPASSSNLYIMTASQKKIQISIKISPIIEKTNKGEPTSSGLVIVFRDITRERAEQNAQTDFVSTASHEMRTPVATIEGYLGMILNPNICTIDDRARDYAEKSHQAIVHLGHLFQDLLDVTKADDNRLILRPLLIDAATATQQIVDSFKAKAAEKGLELIYTEPNAKNSNLAPPTIIYVDLDRLAEIISNMIENAIKYTAVGKVTVSVHSQDGRVRISVTDTGIGIPAEDIPHLFQKFYRVDNSETREIGGTGLGLYLIKRLSNSMGGSVGVESEYSKGSTFWVEFDNLSREQALQRAREIKKRQEKEAIKQDSDNLDTLT